MGSGAGWSALGAALQGGMSGYTRAQQLAIEKRRADTQDVNAKLESTLLTDKVNELPQQHAEKDVAAYTAQYGDDRFNNPGFLAAAKLAKLNIPTQDVQLARVQDIESGAGNPTPTTLQMANRLGVAPDTGAKLPASVLMTQKNNARQGALDDLQVKAMSDAFGSGGQSGSGFERDANGVITDTPRNRQMGSLLGANDPVVKIHGPAGQSPDNVAARARAEQAVKTEVPSAMMQRVTGQMTAMTDNLTTAQRELERMFPGIDKAVVLGPDGKDTGTGAYNGALDLAKAKLQRSLYNFAYTPFNKAIQASSLGNVNGWGSIVPGRINGQIVDKLKEHQSAFGNETPLATYQRNKELIEMVNKNRAELLASGRPPVAPPVAAPLVPPVAPAGPLSVDAIEGRQLAQAPPQTAPTNVAPPSGAPPPVAPASGAAPTGAFRQIKPGDTITMAELTQRLAGTGKDPLKMAAGLKAQGVNVVKDAAAPGLTPPIPPTPSTRPSQPRPVGSIGPGAPVAPHTIGSLLTALPGVYPDSLPSWLR